MQGGFGGCLNAAHGVNARLMMFGVHKIGEKFAFPSKAFRSDKGVKPSGGPKGCICSPYGRGETLGGISGEFVFPLGSHWKATLVCFLNPNAHIFPCFT